MLVNELHIDDYLKIEYNEKNNNEVNLLEAVGATDNPDLRTLDFEPDNTNSIFVHKSGSDVSGDGTIENPYNTVQKGIDSTTSSKPNVVINDSGLYEEQLSIPADSECNRLVANLGFMPIITPPENLEDIKFNQSVISVGGLAKDGSGNYNKTIDAIALESPFTITHANSPMLISNGNFAVIYYRINIIDTDHRVYQLRLRIYDSTLSYPLSDKLVQEKDLDASSIGGTWDTYDFYWQLMLEDCMVLYYHSSRSADSKFWYIALWIDFDGNIIKEDVKLSTVGLRVWNNTGFKPYLIKDNYFAVRERTGTSDNEDIKIFNGTTEILTIPYSIYKVCYFKGIDDNDVFFDSTTHLIKANIITKTITAETYANLSSLDSSFVSLSCCGIFKIPDGNYLISLTADKIHEVEAIPPTSIVKTVDSGTKWGSDLRFNPYYYNISESKVLFYGSNSSHDKLYILDLPSWNNTDQEGFVYDELSLILINIDLLNFMRGSVGLTGLYKLFPLKDYKFSYNFGGYKCEINSTPFRFYELFDIALFKTDKTITLDGFTFDLNKDGRIRQVLKSKGDLILKTCSLKNGYNDNHGLKFPNYILNKTDGMDIDISYSSFENFDNGISCTVGDFKLNRSKIARVLNSEAIKVGSTEYTYYELAKDEDAVGSGHWSNITDTLVSGTSTALGTGLANSNLIINQVGHTSSGANLALAYEKNGYTDWYLPSKDELNLILNLGTITDYGYDKVYWSSSEENATTAWILSNSLAPDYWYADVKTKFTFRSLPMRNFNSYADYAIGDVGPGGGYIVGKYEVGSGTIEIDHNTIFKNFKGIKINGNNAETTTAKNNIFHANSDYDLEVENEITIYNTCYTDEMNNVLIDSTCRNANPLFIDEGIENVNLTNLNLKSRALGFPSNSPAVELAEEGKDSGCYNVEYVFAPYTYDSFFIPKPKKIGISYIPVNPVETIMQDGTYDISVEAFQQVTELEYSSLKQNYIKDILKLSMIGGDVRLYYMPLSNPDKFEKCKFVYKDLDLANDLYKLNRAGIKGISLKFIRKFTIDELE
jgi:hypothetical protein